MKIVQAFGTTFSPVLRFVCPKCGCMFDADSRDYIHGPLKEEKENIKTASVCPMCGTYCGRTVSKSIFIKEGDSDGTEKTT